MSVVNTFSFEGTRSLNLGGRERSQPDTVLFRLLATVQCSCSHVIKLKLSSQLIGQFGHMTASASCKQPEKYGTGRK